MKEMLMNTSVYVPSARLNDQTLRNLIAAAVLEIGGVTITEGRGQWYDNEAQLVTDHILIHEFYSRGGEEAQKLACHIYRIVDRLLEQGEDSVAVTQQGCRMVLIDDRAWLATTLADLEMEVVCATLH